MIRKKSNIAMTFIFFVAFALFGIGVYYLGPSITGFVTKQFIYEKNLNLVVTASTNYNWQPGNLGEMKAVKLYGKVTNYGKARVYIENAGTKYLIFDSSKLNESTAANQENLITGFAVKEENAEDANQSDKEKKKKNKAPEWNGTSKFTINATTDINLSNYFSDKDSDSLVYSASENEDVQISLNREIATIIPNTKNTNTTIVFTASDGIDSMSKIVEFIIVVEKEPSLINRAPVWNSNIGSFNIDGITKINLSKYFVDEDSDSLVYSHGLAENILISINDEIATIMPFENFHGNTSAVFSAYDSKNLTIKSILLIVPEKIAENTSEQVNQTNESKDKSIAINLAYNPNTIYDANDNGEESVNGVVDLSITGTSFSWNPDESKLCTRWEVYNLDESVSTTFCNGNNDCCAFVDLLPTKKNWSEVYYAAFNKDGAGYNNIVSSQIIFYDVNLSLENSKSDVYYSGWANKSVRFFNDETEFEGICIETCSLSGLNKTFYNLIFEIEDNAVLRVDKILYTMSNDIEPSSLMLIKNFSAIIISKNSTESINLSEYFYNPSGSKLIYDYYKADHLEIFFDNDIAKIIPEKNFTGAIYTYITANDSNDYAASNVFEINVLEDIKINPRVIIKRVDFKPEQDVNLEFEYLTKQELAKRNKWKDWYEVYEDSTDLRREGLEPLKQKIEKKDEQINKWQSLNERVEAKLSDSKGSKTNINAEIEELREGRFSIRLPRQREFKAGKYTLNINLVKDGITYSLQQNFTWGVLAINFNKSIYLPNDDAFIGIGVLDDQGKVVCNANITLEITDPSNQKTILTTGDSITINPECRILLRASLPDYYATYHVGKAGAYQINLTASTSNGIKSVLDNLIVQDAVDFDVARNSATRINPIFEYVMNISIVANKNYNGLIYDYVPSSFEISEVELHEVSEQNFNEVALLEAEEGNKALIENSITKLISNEKEKNGFHSLAIAPEQNLVSQRTDIIKQNLYKNLSFEEGLTKLGWQSLANAPDLRSGVLNEHVGSNSLSDEMDFPPPASINNIDDNSIAKKFIKENKEKIKTESHNQVLQTNSTALTELSNVEAKVYINFSVSSDDLSKAGVAQSGTAADSDSAALTGLRVRSSALESKSEVPSSSAQRINKFFNLLPSANAQAGGLAITTVNDTKIITISANLKKGSKYVLSYKFDALDTSPGLLSIGSLEIGKFKEAREWQIASDAPTKQIMNYKSTKIEGTQKGVDINISNAFLGINITPTQFLSFANSYDIEPEKDTIYPYFSAVIPSTKAADLLTNQIINVTYSLSFNKDISPFYADESILLKGNEYFFRKYFFCSINDAVNFTGNVTNNTLLDKNTVLLNVSYKIPSTIKKDDVITCYDPIQPNTDFSNSSVVLIGTGDPGTTIGNLSTDIPAGTNLVIVSAQFNGTSGTIPGGNLQVRRNGTTNLGLNNSFNMRFAASPNQDANWMGAICDFNAPASPYYEVNATASTANAVRGQANIVVISGVTCFQNVSEITTVPTAAAGSTMAHIETSLPVGNHTIIAVSEVNTSSGATRNINANNLQLRNVSGNTFNVMTSNEFNIDFDVVAAGNPLSHRLMQTFVNFNAPANQQYNVTAIADNNNVAARTILIAIDSNNMSVNYTNATKTLTTEITPIVELNTTFQANGDVVVIGAEQFDQTSGTARYIEHNGISLRQNNDTNTNKTDNKIRIDTEVTSTDEGMGFALIRRYANNTANPYYGIYANASGATIVVNAQLLAIRINNPSNDITAPDKVNTSFNISSPTINQVINFTGNATDDRGLVSMNITYNFSGVITYLNLSLSGNPTYQEFSNVTTLCSSPCVINFTMYATDIGQNVVQNSTLVSVGSGAPDVTFPIANTTLNATIGTNGYQFTARNIDFINFSGNVTDETSLSTANWTINFSSNNQFMNHSVSGVSAQVSNATDLSGLVNGSVLNFTLLVTDTSNNVKQNSTLVLVTDAKVPVVNTTFNITKPFANDVLNFTGNITEETGLLYVNITWNISGIITYSNYTLNGVKTAQVSNATLLSGAGGSVINFTMFATDTSNNVKQNSTLITLFERAFPIVNTTLNATIGTNGYQFTARNIDFLNFTGNVTDDTRLLSANWSINFTSGKIFMNYTLSGQAAQVSNTTNLSGLVNGSVLNFTLYVTDTSDNVKQNSTVLIITDALAPVVNTTFNISAPVINDVINFTGNITDETGLLMANITWNISGVITYSNYTLSGTTAQVSNATTLPSTPAVINFTMYATDTSNNVKQNSTLITVTNHFSITNCSNLTRVNAIYDLTKNASNPATCFNILANNVTLDCHGLIVNYSQSSMGYGVNNSGFNYSTIRSCNIVQAAGTSTIWNSHAIYETGLSRGLSYGNLIYNNSITANGTGAVGAYLVTNIFNNSIYNNMILSTYEGVVLDTNTSNNSIFGNNITTTTISGSEGIMLITDAYNNFIYNNLIKTTDYLGTGIRLYKAYNNIIYYNNISTTGGSSAYGISMETASYNNSAYGNNVNASATGIWIVTNSYNNSIYSNNITTESSTGTIGQHGIEVWSNSSGNDIYNNSILTKGGGSSGIRLDETAYYNKIHGNNITTSSSTGIAISAGIYLGNNVNNNTIYDNNITVKGSSDYYGIYLWNASNNTFYRNTLSSLTSGIFINGTGFKSSKSEFNSFTNDTIVPCSNGCSSTYQDIILQANATDITFTNVSFNKSRVSLLRLAAGAKTNMTVRWFVDVNVTNSSNNNPIANAQVVINDTNGLNIFNSTTDATGGIPTQIIVEYTQNGSVPWRNNDSCREVLNTLTTQNLTCFTTYNISVNLTGYINTNTKVDVNRSKFLNLSMTISTTTVGALLVNISSPINNTQVSANTTFVLIANVTCTNANCGVVQGFARYNDSTSNVSNKSISITFGATPLFINSTSSGIKQYNFVGITYPSPITMSNATYGYHSSTKPLQVNLTSETEFGGGGSTANNYTNISSLDNVFARSTKASSGYAAHKFTFKINESEGSVSKLTIFWNGTGGFDPSLPDGTAVNANLSVWNSNAWEVIGNCTSSGVSPDSHPGCVINTTISTNIANYINETDNNAVYILALSMIDALGGTSKIRTTYIELNVTSTAQNPLSCGNMLQNDKCQLNWTINASGNVGSQIVVDVNFSSDNANVVANDTEDHLIVIVSSDTTLPRINASLEDSNPGQYQIVNLTANVSDETALSFCQFIDNQSLANGQKTYINKSVTGASDQCSQKYTIALAAGNVINFTVIVNDTTNNINTSINRSDSGAFVIGQIVTVSTSKIGNCTNLTTANTNYTLLKNASSPATCFNILANNITLDCKGYWINYSQSDVGYGVNISSYNFSIVKSCNIIQADLATDNSNSFGVYVFKNAINNSVYNNTITTSGTAGYGVYLFSTAYNNSVYSNTITTSGSTGFGVYLSTTAYNNSVYSNNITTSGSSGYGVYLFSTAYSNNVYSNTITTSGSSGYGVYLISTAYNNSVYSNNITTSGSSGYGVYLVSAAYNNSVYSNTITTSGSSGLGVYLSTTAYNNSVYSNNITTSGSSGYGVDLFSTAYSNNVYSNNITTSNISGYGIYLNNDVFNNTIYNNNITTKNMTSSYGIYLLRNVKNNTFYRNTISSLAAAIVINGSTPTASEWMNNSLNTFTNDTIIPCSTGCDANYQDIILTANVTDITFTNVSFNKSRIGFMPMGPDFPVEKNNITVRWFLDVNVTNSTNNNPIANAQVVINDTNGLNIFNSTTDATGGIPTQIIVEYTQNGSVPWRNNDSCREVLNTLTTQNLTCFTTYNISVNLTGYINTNTKVDVNRSKVLNLSMTISTTTVGALLVNISSPINNTQVSANTTFVLIANVTCTNADCGVVQGLARYNDSTSNVSNKSISVTQFATPLFINSISSGIKHYDFGGITYPSPITMSNATYGYHTSTKPLQVNLTSETEFGGGGSTANNYTNISSLDNVFAAFSTSTSGRYPAHKFTFKINESENSVSKLTIFWNGTGGCIGDICSSGVGINLSIWNSSAWHVLGNCTKPGINPNTDTGCVVNVSITTTISNYINETDSNAVYLLALSDIASISGAGAGTSYVRTNYIELNVTTTAANPLSCGNMLQNDKCQLNWTINASGNVGSQLVLDVNFSSDNANVVANDTEDHLIVIVSSDTTLPRINASLEDSNPGQYQIVNLTANVSDETALSFCQFIDNQSLANGQKTYINKSVTGASDQCSQKYTIALPAGNVINFTVIVNDTTNNINTSVNRSDGGALVIGQIVTVSTSKIGNCTNLTVANTNYTLLKNASSPATCFNILANNITLDCKGYWINYSQSSKGFGVNNSGFNYSTVRSCIIATGSIQISSFAISIASNSNNNTIFNNSIITRGSSSYGVYLDTDVFNTSVRDNTIRTSEAAAYGVYLDTHVHNNNIYNNNITITGNTGAGIRLTSSAYNNSIFGNYIFTNNFETHGITLVTTAYNNYIYDNNITTKNASGLNNGGAFGILISTNSSNNTFYRNKISSFSVGIMFNGTSSKLNQFIRWNTFTNDTIVPCTTGCAANYQDIVLTANVTDITFTNISFNKSRVGFMPMGPDFPVEKNNMTFQWFIDVNVTNATNNNPIANAQVVINDTNGFNIFNSTTDTTGGIPTQTIVEYTQNGSVPWGNNDSCRQVLNTLTTENLTCFTTYNISVNLTGYINNNTKADVNRSKFLNLSMTIIPTDTCSCPSSGDWVGSFADNCVISSDCNLQGNSLYLSGAGTWTINALIYNFNRIVAHQGTLVCIKQTGCFG